MPERTVSKYRVGAALGGHMGRVYRARDTELGRTVAMKFLAPELAADSAAVERFLQEARFMATLDHRYICPVHDIGQDDDGTWYIAMGWCNGATLKQSLAHGPLPPAAALEYARQTALGLAHAHDHGIVHRDIKPANLILTADGEVRIVDFGVARLLGAERRTQAGALVGTFGYLSPEQVRGEDATPASDMWSLGVVLYEMLAGRLPFTGENHAAQLDAIARDDPDTLPIDGDVVTAGAMGIIGRCLRKDPTARFGSAHELAAELAGVLGTRHANRPTPTPVDPVAVDPPPPPTPAPPANGRPPRRRLYAAVTAAALLVALLVAVPGVLEQVRDRLLGPSTADRGVAVLPFEIVGEPDGDPALGQGLAWCLTDRLEAFCRHSEDFWLVPPGDVRRAGVRFPEGARARLGARRVVSGTGQRVGDDIELRLTVYDTRTRERTERTFHDTAANLRTWQQDLAAWVAGVLDPDLAGGVPVAESRGCTLVPDAFMAYVRGVGAREAAERTDPATWEAPLAHFHRAVAADSAFARARAELGLAVHRRALPSVAEAAAAGLAHLAAALRLDPDLAWAFYYRGLIREATGDVEAALAACVQGLAIEPDHGALLRLQSDLLAASGRGDEAFASLEHYIKVRPDYHKGYMLLGSYHYNAGEFGLAEEAFGSLVERAPANREAHENLATTMYWGREDPAAEAVFQRAIELGPTASCYSNLGILYYYEHRYEDAVGAFENALALDSDLYLVWHLLAEACRWIPERAATARTAYARAAALGEEELLRHPGNPGLLANVASYYSFLGDEERAVELLAELQTMPPTEGDDAFTVASAYEDLGRRDEALLHLERALATGGRRTIIDDYPGFRNLRTDARYQALIRRYP